MSAPSPRAEISWKLISAPFAFSQLDRSVMWASAWFTWQNPAALLPGGQDREAGVREQFGEVGVWHRLIHSAKCPQVTLLGRSLLLTTLSFLYCFCPAGRLQWQSPWGQPEALHLFVLSSPDLTAQSEAVWWGEPRHRHRAWVSAGQHHHPVCCSGGEAPTAYTKTCSGAGRMCPQLCSPDKAQLPSICVKNECV